MQIKISVVIPTYRRPHLLRKCVTALTTQKFDQGCYEILVVSDGYDAITESVVREFSLIFPLITYHHLSVKKGPAAARNCGWKEARGKVVAFTDDDTVPDANWLQAYWNAYDGTSLIAFTGKIKVPLSATPTDYERNTAGLETANFVTANCCCTKEALEKVHGFDERFSMAWREDSDLEFKLLQNQIPIVHVPEALIVHPVREAPWGISIKEQRKGMYNALLYKKYPELYRKKIQPSPPWNYYIIVLSVILMIFGALAGSTAAFFASFLCWLFFTMHFVIKRLSETSRSFMHVLEMILTSMVIPFLSIYWQLYGAYKYRVLFL
jgi:glycosyltransferase involved in cell wall biosynthesis